MNFFQRFSAFMQGRYGLDSLNKFIIGFSFVIYIVNMFVFNHAAHLIIMLLNLAVLGILVFRFLSRNTVKRSAENRAFTKIWDPVKGWFKFTVRRIKDRDNYRYRKCPTCKAQLRVRNVKGEHTVRCPKCRCEFKTKI